MTKLVAVHRIFGWFSKGWSRLAQQHIIGCDSITKYSYKINFNNLFLLEFFVLISNSQNCEMRSPFELWVTDKKMERAEIQSFNFIMNLKKRISLPN